MAKIILISSKDNNFYNFRSELILKLNEIGHEVILVCPQGEKIKYFTDRGCRFIALDMDRRGMNYFKDFKLIVGYYQIFKKEKPDIVLTYTGKSSAYGGIVCSLLKIPYIINNAGLIDTRFYSRYLEIVLNTLYRLGFKKASCMMYQNTQERDFLNGILHHKVYYRDIPGSGVNLTQFQYAEYPKDDSVIVFNYVARIVEIKGITEYLDCAERIKEKYPNTRFVIYGDYDDEEKYRIRIEELQQKGIVEYGGVKLDMKPYIKAAHAVIHPSYYEGMTNVVLEHSAMGRPCIGSDIPGVKDGITEGVTGYTFPVKNVDALTAVVERFILLSHEQKAEMGRAARKKMEQNFDRNIVTNIYLEEIDRILKNNGTKMGTL